MPPKGTTDEKLNQLIGMMQSLQTSHDETKQLLADSLTRMSELEQKVSTLGITVSKQENEILGLKIQANNREITSRSSSARLVGHPVEDDESRSVDGGKAFIGRIFDKILKPILVVAKAKGEILQIPTAANAIESAYRAGKSVPGTRPPSVIINFVSRQLRLAILRHKKGNIPAYGLEETRLFIG